jgi:hypothetical protein
VKLIRHCAGISGNKTIIVENNPMSPICHLLRADFAAATGSRSGIITISWQFAAKYWSYQRRYSTLNQQTPSAAIGL